MIVGLECRASRSPSTGCQRLTPFLPLIYLRCGSPVLSPQRWFWERLGLAAHVSRMPMGENKAAASQKHRHRRLQGSLPDQGEEPWGGSPDLQASEEDVLLVWDE